MDVLPRMALGQCRPPEPGQAAPPGQDRLEERLASTGQSQCTAGHGTSHHHMIYTVIVIVIVIVIVFCCY